MFSIIAVISWNSFFHIHPFITHQKCPSFSWDERWAFSKVCSQAIKRVLLQWAVLWIVHCSTMKYNNVTVVADWYTIGLNFYSDVRQNQTFASWVYDIFWHLVSNYKMYMHTNYYQRVICQLSSQRYPSVSLTWCRLPATVCVFPKTDNIWSLTQKLTFIMAYIVLYFMAEHEEITYRCFDGGQSF